MYTQPFLTQHDKDVMSDFAYASIGRVLTADQWAGTSLPQGVSVFKRHSSGRFEYMFTKDEKYSGTVDARYNRDEVREMLIRYTPKNYIGNVYYMNEDAMAIVSKHRKHPY